MLQEKWDRAIFTLSPSDEREERAISFAEICLRCTHYKEMSSLRRYSYLHYLFKPPADIFSRWAENDLISIMNILSEAAAIEIAADKSDDTAILFIMAPLSYNVYRT